MAKPLVVFCDFDGTITERDMIVAVCEKFCPPAWKEVARDIAARRKNVREGVAELFAMIPSNKKEAIIAFTADCVRFRPGFQDFLAFCRDNGLLFTVCSGGIDFFVNPIIERFQPWIHKSYTIPANFSGPMIKLSHPYGCDQCGMCKVKVMDEYSGAIKILVGDGITDVHGAHHATRVFARDKLKAYLDADGVRYHPFETFHDIIGTLSRFQGHGSNALMDDDLARRISSQGTTHEEKVS